MAKKIVAKKETKRVANKRVAEVKIPLIDAEIVADDPDFVPTYASEEAACCDLVANIQPQAEMNGQCRINITSRNIALIDCGFSMSIPKGYKAEIMLRSGHAKKGYVILNSPGQLDSDYRGRVKVLLGNVGKEILTLDHKERFAQMCIVPVYRFNFHPVDKLTESSRGDGGFGSTGTQVGGLNAPPKSEVK